MGKILWGICGLNLVKSRGQCGSRYTARHNGGGDMIYAPDVQVALPTSFIIFC